MVENPLEGMQPVWWQAPAQVLTDPNKSTAYAYICENFILKLAFGPLGQFQWVFDDTNDTINLVFPEKYEAEWKMALAAAGFEHKIIPVNDPDAMAEYHEALIRGGKF